MRVEGCSKGEIKTQSCYHYPTLLCGQQQQLCGQESVGIPCSQAAFCQGTTRYCWHLGHDHARLRLRQQNPPRKGDPSPSCFSPCSASAATLWVELGAYLASEKERCVASSLLSSSQTSRSSDPLLSHPRRDGQLVIKRELGRAVDGGQGTMVFSCFQCLGWWFRTPPLLVRAESKCTVLAQQSAGCGLHSGSGCYQKCGLP